jgi:hypothetical protein
MAISRAQLAKELEPGLNSLFGMSYDSYDREYEESSQLKILSVPSRKKFSLPASVQHQRKLKVKVLSLIMLASPTRHAIRIRQLRWHLH